MKKIDKLIFWSISISLIGALWYYQYLTTINIPFWDDFHGVMLPVYDLFTDLPIIEKIKSFFSLNNEHRVVNDRIFSLIIFSFFKEFELRYLALFGFINLIIIFAIYLKICKGYISNLYLLLPVPLLIFQAKYSEGLQFLMVPFQNFSVILYAYLCFYFLIFKKINRLIPAGVFALLSFFSHGNGILCFVIGGFILICYENKKPLYYWLVFSAIAIPSYFIGYQKPTWTDAPELKVSIGTSILYMFEFIGSYFLIFVELSQTLYGGVFQKLVPAFFGLLMVSLFVFYLYYFFIRKYGSIPKAFNQLTLHKVPFFLVSTILFFGCTAIVIGITRAGFMVFSRYTINSAFALCSLYLLLIPHLKRQKLFSAIFIFILSLGCIFSYYNSLTISIFNKRNSVYDAYNWKTNGTWASQYSDSMHVQRLNPLLKPIFDSGKYKFPSEVDSINLELAKPGKIEYQKIEKIDAYIELTMQTNAEETILCLKNKENCFLMPSLKIKSPLANFLKTGQYYSGIERIDFPINVIPNKEYEVYLFQKTPEGLIISNTNKKIVNRAIVKI